MKLKRCILLNMIVLLGISGFTWAAVENVSVGKTATASSQWSADAGPEKAVDGIAPQSFPIFHSGGGDRTPWWQVDLGAEYVITEIMLWNRQDCCQVRLRDITVEIMDPFGTAVYSTVVNPGGVLGNPATITITLNAPVPGKLVKVSRTEDLTLSGDDRYLLQLAEVQVFAEIPGATGAYNPTPENNADRVGTAAASPDEVEVTLGWDSSLKTDPGDPNLLIVNPDLVEHKVYISIGSSITDPNMITDPNYPTILLATIPAGSPIAPSVQHGPINLDRQRRYYWRVDEVVSTGTIQGNLWMFETDYDSPIILTQPSGAYAWSVESAPPAGKEAESATFTVSAENPYTKDDTGMTYEWFKVGPGKVGDGASYSIPAVSDSDAGVYYCIVTLVGESMKSTQSANASLTIKHIVGHWPFDADFEDKVAGYHGTPLGDPLPIIDSAEKINGPGSAKFSLGGAAPQAVQIPSDGVPDQSSFTISFWENTPADGPSNGYILASGDANPSGSVGYEYLYIWRRAGDVHYLGLYVGADFTTGNFASGDLGGIPREEWHFCTFVYDYDTMVWDYYVDGLFRYTYGQLAARMEGFVDDFFVANRENMARAFMGNIDDLRIYDYPMSPREVAHAYLDVWRQHDPDAYICDQEGYAEWSALDFNGDCQINILDYAMLAGEFLKCDRIPESACD